MDRGKSEEECKELAARTVNKQRAEHGETKEGREYRNVGDPCPNCKHPLDEDDSSSDYINPICHHCGWPSDEPAGAGADPFGRPDPRTHPEYWTE